MIEDRVIALASSIYYLGLSRFQYDDLDASLQRPQHYSMFEQYAKTKWCNILHALNLYEFLGITALPIHPGTVRTDVVRNMRPFMRIGYYYVAGWLLASIQKTPAQGAWATLDASNTAPSPRLYRVNRTVHELRVKPSKEQIQRV